MAKSFVKKIEKAKWCCGIRPVTKEDKWCKIRMHEENKEGDAPWGYIVTVPYLPKQTTLLEGIDGCIIRTKKHCGKFLLQVIPKKFYPDYTMVSLERDEPNVRGTKKDKKKKYQILNIRNLNKLQRNW